MATAVAGIEEELDTVAQKVRDAVLRLEKVVPTNKKDEFELKKTEAFTAIKRNQRIISSLKELRTSSPVAEVSVLSDHINKLGPPLYDEVSGLDRQLLLSLRNETEQFDRRVQLLIPTSKNSFLQGLWWMSQRGSNLDLDVLVNVKHSSPFAKGAALQMLRQAQKEITVRNNKEILDFFGFDAAELLTIIEATLRQPLASDAHARNAPEEFALKQPSQIIDALEVIRDGLKGFIDALLMRKWLDELLAAFGGRTARELLFDGYAAPILLRLTKLTTTLEKTRHRKKLGTLMMVITSLFVLVGFSALSRTAVGFAMAFGGTLLTYECYLLLRATRISPLIEKGLK
jgi:hypothetical protein